MAILYLCQDTEDSSELREIHRDAHFSYIESIMDELLVAGPVQPTSDSGWKGSVFLYATDDQEKAKSLLHNDPYHRAGIYRKVEAHPFLPAAGRWLGGGIWQENVEEKEQDRI